MSPTLVQPRENAGSCAVAQRNSMSISQTKGLLNGPGQNNCFLNSAIQVLWHLDIFRRSFRELTGHACMADSCIFCALKELFVQFQYNRESALPPDALRRALAETFFNQQRFQLGFMDDAAECFENMLLRIHFHIANTESEDMCNAPHCIPHQKFAMTLVEQSICHACGATSEPLPFTQMVHYVSASALCLQAKQLLKGRGQNFVEFGHLLRRAGGMGDIRECPSSCGAKIQICRSLMNRPEIVSIGIVWDSEHPTLEHIMNVFRTIGTSISLPDIFHSVVDKQWASSTVHHLVGVVTYYGKHYSTFFFHTKLHVWIYFDDATVREIGPRWEQVVEKCQRGHFQPLLLLYANAQGSPISLETAPQTITYVSDHCKAQKEEFSKKDLPKGPINPSMLHMKLNGTAAIQRRAVTPNPESARELSNETCPRRAVTPNPDKLYIQQWPSMKVPDMNANIKEETLTTVPAGTYNNRNEPVPNYNDFSTNHQQIISDNNRINCPSVDKPAETLNPHEANMKIKDEQKTNRPMYISRKTVENVLNYQKLQRQRSLSTGNYSNVGNRNSNSSLESFDNMRTRNNSVPGTPPDFKGDLNDFGVLGRRRDSGNWSGDRNSASSGSSLSLENPYFYVTGSKQPSSSSGYRDHPGKPVEITANPMYDPGYDSYSLSSNDSFPLSPQTKHNQQLAQIPENPFQNASHHENYLQSCKTVSLDDCEKLCVEADQFLEKSRGLEDLGDFSSAISLCNSAAAKARAAMDAPYTNPQALMFARMKHNTCIMRARGLQRRFLMRQESINSHGSTTSTETDSSDNLHADITIQGNHVRQASSDSQKRRENNHSRQNSRDGSNSGHSRQNSRDSRQSNKEFVSHSRQSSKDSNSKNSVNIEIYATLPKKNSKKKLEKTISSDSIRGKDDKGLSQHYIQRQKDFHLDKQSSVSVSSLQENNSERRFLKDTISRSKKKEKSWDKGDADFSDYASDWELTRKCVLHRTYSTPPLKTSPLLTQGHADSNCKDKTDLNKPVTQPGKKQHKIRRKLLMGGLIRRKNRSMPDLREGQDGTDSAPNQHSFDDLQLHQNEKLKTQKPLTGYLSDAHLNYVTSDSMQKLQRNKIHYGSYRQVNDISQKIPPQPPLRTTSQLTIDTLHPKSQDFITSGRVAKSESMSSIRSSSMNFVNLLSNKASNNQCPDSQICFTNHKPSSHNHMYVNHHHPNVPQVPSAENQKIIMQTETYSGPNEIMPEITGPPSSHMINHSKEISGSGHQLYNNKPENPASHVKMMTYVPPKNDLKSSMFTAAPISANLENSNGKHDETTGFLSELQAKRQSILEKKIQHTEAANEESHPIINEELNMQTNSNNWLQELQAKQVQMLQKRNQEQIPSSDVSKKLEINGLPSRIQENKHKKEHIPAPHQKNVRNLMFVLPPSLETDADHLHSCSVRDLASKFEQIMSPTMCAKFQLGLSIPTSHGNNEISKGGDFEMVNKDAHHIPPLTVGDPIEQNGLQACHLRTETPSNIIHSSAGNGCNDRTFQDAKTCLGKPISTTNRIPTQASMPTLKENGNNTENNVFIQHNAGPESNVSYLPLIKPHIKLNQENDVNIGLHNKAGRKPPPYSITVSRHSLQPNFKSSVDRINCIPKNQTAQLQTAGNFHTPIDKPNRDDQQYTELMNRNYANYYMTRKQDAPQITVSVGEKYRDIHQFSKPFNDNTKDLPYQNECFIQPQEKVFSISNNALNKNNCVPKPNRTNSLHGPPDTKINGNYFGESKPADNHGVIQTFYQNGDLERFNGRINESSDNNKKRIKSKKSVTFSDQIALVASADDDPEEFIPNPLLEKVYKSVVQQNHVTKNQVEKITVQHSAQRAGGNELLITEPKETVCESKANEIASLKTNVNKVPCHLCRKKTVIPPVVYCPDCDFYMSRFKPKS